MNIWIDVCHTPQFNFFKPVIEELARRGHVIYITVLDRGKTPRIVRHDVEGLANVHVDVVGRHRMNKWSAIFEANLLRMVKLLWWAIGKHIDVALTTSMFPPIIGKLYGFPAYTFGDDAQVFDFKIKNRWATHSHMCMFEWTLDKPKPEKTEVLRCLKEWAYLNPRTFVPKVKVLEKYGVKPKEYMFLREVSVGTINYAGQASGAILGIKDMIPTDMRVLFSLEEKKRRNEYPEDWILLQEPIEDIHSLIYYSAGLVSSGDSMAREAALLGVPSYYLGIRYSMPANAAASKVASLQNQRTMSFEAWVREYITKNTESQVTCSNSHDFASQSAQEQAHGQLDNQTPATDTDKSYLLDSSQKRNKNAKNGHADENVIEQRMKQQDELRKHIDEEFIDINAYMLALVENNK